MEERANDSEIIELLKGIPNFYALMDFKKFIHSENDNIQKVLKHYEEFEQSTLKDITITESAYKEFLQKKTPWIDEGYFDSFVDSHQFQLRLANLKLYYAHRRQKLLNDLPRDTNVIGKFRALRKFDSQLRKLKKNMKSDLKNIDGEEDNLMKDWDRVVLKLSE
ncbi:uncharacterized protein PHALS_03422 [Plasmopara halstedii]|uniref:Uncharacterized protein n=1 Tax=Plasmopara halstedii TaxID=4781 RepID=A0A0P1AZ77_PLAHL|nr:uncharacterized protein PHALS_03422 [Plasmopara halstedii]CEG46738.1 hypothetical protein PHALS_03422 [Plasmopara halstedii]|eukprot:XP_024583107.1 hypothetical protein PHALS_03422 [Plasmopara halstedii]